MASASGTSIAGTQVIARGILGSFEKFYLYLPDPQFARPTRVGYYWYGAATAEGTIEFLYAKDTLTTWGVAVTRAEKSDANRKVDTFVVDWNAAGIPWVAFW